MEEIVMQLFNTENKSAIVKFRVTPTEKERLKQVARSEGKTVTSFIVDVLNDYVGDSDSRLSQLKEKKL